MTKKISKFSLIFLSIFIIVGWVFLIYSLGKNNLSNPNLWFDESGQFWMAKGLNHFSPPQQKEGNLIDVIRENSRYNLDPGGFTILLHYWTKISTSPSWLRLLPYLFYIGSCIVLSLIVYEISRLKILSLLALWYLTLFRGDLFYFGFEIRAYSMECFGVVLSLLMLLKYLKNKSIKYLLVLNIVLAIFVSSRYSFIVCAFVISIVTFFGGNKVTVKKIITYAPIFFSLVIIYFASYRWQFHLLESPGYTQDFMIKYMNHNQLFILVKNNLLSLKSIATTSIIILGVYLFFLSYPVGKVYKKIIVLSLFSAFYSAIFILLSVLGIHTWDINIRWNLALQLISALNLMSIVSLFLFKITSKKETFKSRLLPILAMFSFVISSKYLFRYIDLSQLNTRTSSDSIYSNILALNIDLSKQIYVAYEDTPTWRYLNEYGPLKEGSQYPKNTIFGKKKDPESIYLKADYVIQSNKANIDFSEDISKGLMADITIYEPNHIYKVNKKVK